MTSAGGAILTRRSRVRVRRLLPIYALLLPGLVLYAAWAAWPLLNSFVLSFTDWSLTRPPTPVGLANYQRALGDPLFWKALSGTLGYTVVTARSSGSSITCRSSRAG